MADLKKFENNPQKQLLENLKDVRCVMLGTPNQDKHMQPMSPQVDVENNEIYFYSDNTSELGQAVLEKPGFVHMCLVEKDYQACVKGYLITHKDRDTIEKFWSPVVAAWYPDGKSDSKLMMLRFVPHDAAIWASTGNPLKFAYEIAKANLTDGMPDLGDMKNVELDAA
ncbi:pyridoxamine 5'-phosphate oxidase family protein [Litorimonas sp. RW-G-Af-16]|uniref:pyridoxamine 5'-phosphate oxidase family protein n=1 Tax=Litorimonas sp. RW-G-Af-16 TaxID=3241168 RepID=UPI00390C47D8